MRFNPIGNKFAAVVDGIDLCAPLSSAQAATIHAGMDRHAVLVFHDQPLTDEQQIVFTRSLGKIELNTANNITRLDQRRLSIEMSDISNLDQHSNILAGDDRRRAFNLGNRLWHSDSSFKAVSAKYSVLSARIIPSAGGNTEFADMRTAYDALDPEIKAEIDDLITEHSLLFSRGQLGFTEFTAEERVKFAPVRHRLVRTNPTTCRKSLFLSSHIGGIVGWPVPEAMALVRDLVEHATQRQFVYAHTWRQHDLVMWDNRQTMHRARRGARHAPRSKATDRRPCRWRSHRSLLAGSLPTRSSSDERGLCQHRLASADWGLCCLLLSKLSSGSSCPGIPTAYTNARLSVVRFGRIMICTRAIQSILLALVLVTVAGMQPTLAQPYPNRPIRVINPAPAGGALDIAFRLVQPQLSRILGVPLVITNRVGGSGIIGMEAVATAKPDGYTLAATSTSTITVVNVSAQRVPYKLDAFIPIGNYAFYFTVLAIRAGAPWQNFDELKTYAKQYPGKLSYGSVGTLSTLNMESIKEAFGLDILQIPYPGAPQAIIAVIGEQLDIAAVPLSGGTATPRS